MKIVYHLGLHCTDEDMALRCLLRNAATLAEQGSVVTLPARFKPVLRETMIALRGAAADADLQQRILDAVTEVETPRQVLFSNDNFLCPPARVAIGSTLYPLADERMPWIRNLFPTTPTTFAFALRNPVTLLPALHARFAKGEPFSDYLERLDVDALSWADAVRRMRAAVPDCEMVVWCNEDAPLIWPEILAMLAGIEDASGLKGATDFVGQIMSPLGLERMTAYLGTHPPKTAEHRRRITAAFLDKFAVSEAVEMEVEAPEFDEARIIRITAQYQADVEAIRALDGITFLSA